MAKAVRFPYKGGPQRDLKSPRAKESKHAAAKRQTCTHRSEGHRNVFNHTSRMHLRSASGMRARHLRQKGDPPRETPKPRAEGS